MVKTHLITERIEELENEFHEMSKRLKEVLIPKIEEIKHDDFILIKKADYRDELYGDNIVGRYYDSYFNINLSYEPQRLPLKFLDGLQIRLDLRDVYSIARVERCDHHKFLKDKMEVQLRVKDSDLYVGKREVNKELKKYDLSIDQIYTEEQ